VQVARRAGGPWRVDAGHQLLYQPLMVKGSPPDGEPLGLLVGAVRRSVRHLLMSRIGARGLSMQQFWLLVGIAEHPCHSQAELAARFRVDEATACRVIRTLSARRWIRTSRDESDRRRVQLALTAQGERLAESLLPVAREVRSAVESALVPEERAAIRAGLVKILAALERLSVVEDAPRARRMGRARRTPERALP